MPSIKTVFIFLGNRIYITDTLRTPFIKELARRHRVVVFFPTLIGGERPDINAYPKLKNVSYHLLPAPLGRFWTFFYELRSEFLTRFNSIFFVRWRAEREDKQRRANFRTRLWRALVKILPTSFLTTEFFTKLEIRLAPGYTAFKTFAQKYNPDLVLVSFAGDSPFEIFATLWARRAGIPTVAYNPTWDKFTVNPKHIRKTDYVITWNEQSREQAIEWQDYSPDEVFVAGALRFDHYFRNDPLPLSREAFLKSKGLDPERKTVFFASQCQGLFYRDFIRAFISWQQNGDFRKPLNLFVRAHTLDSLEAYQEFIGVPGVCVERGGTIKQGERTSGHKTEMDESDLLNIQMTLMYCDLCVTINSTMSVEAMVFDKPAICAGFVPVYSEMIKCESYIPVVECGAARVVGSMEEMREIIEKYFENPALDRENRVQAVKFAMGPTDGYSYKRIADFVDEIMQREYARY